MINLIWSVHGALSEYPAAVAWSFGIGVLVGVVLTWMVLA